MSGYTHTSQYLVFLPVCHLCIDMAAIMTHCHTVLARNMNTVLAWNIYTVLARSMYTVLTRIINTVLAGNMYLLRI